MPADGGYLFGAGFLNGRGRSSQFADLVTNGVEQLGRNRRCRGPGVRDLDLIRYEVAKLTDGMSQRLELGALIADQRLRALELLAESARGVVEARNRGSELARLGVRRLSCLRGVLDRHAQLSAIVGDPRDGERLRVHRAEELPVELTLFGEDRGHQPMKQPLRREDEWPRHPPVGREREVQEIRFGRRRRVGREWQEALKQTVRMNPHAERFLLRLPIGAFAALGRRHGRALMRPAVAVVASVIDLHAAVLYGPTTLNAPFGLEPVELNGMNGGFKA